MFAFAEGRRVGARIEMAVGRTGLAELIPPTNRENEFKFHFVEVPVGVHVGLKEYETGRVYIVGGAAVGRLFNVD